MTNLLIFLSFFKSGSDFMPTFKGLKCETM